VFFRHGFCHPYVATQTDRLSQTLTSSLERLAHSAEQYQWGQWVITHILQVAQRSIGKADVFAKITRLFSTTLGASADFAVILFVGLYLAVDPGLYVGGVVRLVPIRRRERAREVLGAVGYTLLSAASRKLLGMRSSPGTQVGRRCPIGDPSAAIPCHSQALP
jgi:predicted PurR-regulated permease PerM